MIPPSGSMPATTWTGGDLLAAKFPAPRWAVPGVVAEGLTLFCGPPKVGKSWLALDVALAAALGGRALGKVPVDPGHVLLLALEDTPRRLQSRLRMLMADDNVAPELLNVRFEWPETGTQDVCHWLEGHPDARLVVVDVVARTRGPVLRGESAYASDYAAVSVWKTIADRYGVAVLLVHHTRKAASDDFLETVSGTNGLAGSADAIMVLTRSRHAADGKLAITGRDVEEAEHALRFDATHGRWTMLEGPATDYDVGDTRRRILQVVRSAGIPVTPKTLAADLDADYQLVKKTMLRMAKDDQLVTDGTGRYRCPPSALSPVSLVSPDGLSPGETSRDTPETLSLDRGTPGTEGTLRESGKRPSDQGGGHEGHRGHQAEGHREQP